jgi:hypothetical protein
MIKPSIRRPEAAIDLIAQSLRSRLVDFFATRQVVHVEESVAEADVVDRVAVIVGQDLAGEAGVQLDVYLRMTAGSIVSLLLKVRCHLLARSAIRFIDLRASR